ncbi:MAG: hypothetical protein KF754_11375 [Planctomycetes bacterium]|nr:hypothetical protein [Planctomycetota bacterium]
MLAAAGLLWAGLAPSEWRVGRDAGLITALLHLELALGVLLVPYRAGRDRRHLALNFATWAGCWGATSAAVLLFSFVDPLPAALHARALSLCAWLAAGGAAALACCISPDGAMRARMAVAAVFGLPALFHYLGLEYAGASQLPMAGFSPHWLLAQGRIGPAWWLGGAGITAWLAALALCLRARRPA